MKSGRLSESIFWGHLCCGKPADGLNSDDPTGKDAIAKRNGRCSYFLSLFSVRFLKNEFSCLILLIFLNARLAA